MPFAHSTTRLALAAFAVCLPFCAQASSAMVDQPAHRRPTRDVDVVYNAVPAPKAAPHQFKAIRIRFSSAANKERMDAPNGTAWVLLDFDAGKLTFVDEAKKISFVQKTNSAMGEVSLDEDAHWVRAGSGNYAGLACSKWQMVDEGRPHLTVCYTDDGVLLHSEDGGNHVLMDAKSVTYVTPAVSVFVVPAAYAPKNNASSRS